MSFAMNVTVTEIEEPIRLVSTAEGMDARIKERVKLSSTLTLEPRGAETTDVSYTIDLAVIKGKAGRMAADFATCIRVRLEATG